MSQASPDMPHQEVGEADQPLGDAEVWVSEACSERQTDEGTLSSADLSGKPARDCFTTRTTADGKFLIQGFPTNTAANLAVRKPGKVLREPERDSVGPDTMRCWAGQQDIKLVLERRIISRFVPDNQFVEQFGQIGGSKLLGSIAQCT